MGYFYMEFQDTISKLMQNLPSGSFEKVENLKAEIDSLEDEISSLITTSIPWDKFDFIVAVAAGSAGGLVDLIMGRPGEGYSGADEDGLLGKFKEPKIKNDSFGGLGEKLKEYDLLNNPIDMAIPGVWGGDHRLYSFGHDLLRPMRAISLILNGTGPLGIAGTGGVLNLEMMPAGYTPPSSIWEAILVWGLHLYKDFWSPRSLPMPGSSFIAEINGDQMPEFLDKITNHRDFNLRTLSAQILSVAIVEIILRLYVNIRYYKSDYTVDQKLEKKNKLLLLGHTIAIAFNTGKIVATGNPFFLNTPQVGRIIRLAVKVIVQSSELSNTAKTKANLSVLKTSLQTQKATIMLGDAIYLQTNLLSFTDTQLIDTAEQRIQNEEKRSQSIKKLNNRINKLR
jgi:hypothetical protein